jgi:hypothetical protein
MSYLGQLGCCGIKELAQIGAHRTPIEAIKSVATPPQRYDYMRHMYVPHEGGLQWQGNFRFLVFSQAGKRAKYGKALAAFIEENKLGTVTESGQGINPNSRRHLTVWVWTVDHAAVRKLLKKSEKEAKNAAKQTAEAAPVSNVPGTPVRRRTRTPRTRLSV